MSHNRQHKYFRRKRYLNKLENSVDKHHTYYSNVYFTAKQFDLCDLRDDPNYLAAVEKGKEKEYIEHMYRRDRERGYYVYYKRPEVPYTVHYFYKRGGRSKECKRLKRETSKRVRQQFKQKGETYQHNEYRKAREYWWELD